MGKLQKRASMFAGLSLVVTFILLIHLKLARAEEVNDFLPSQGLDAVTLLAGQGVDFEGTFTTSFGTHSIGVVSLGNQTLEVKLKKAMKNITGGFWWILLIGTSTTNGISLVLGLPPFMGQTAAVSFDLSIGFAFATLGVSATSSVSVENPIGYTINIAGKL